MRVDDTSHARTHAPAAGKAAAAPEVSGARPYDTSGVTGAGGDTVDLSALAGALAGFLDSPDRAARTERLAKEYQSGQYSVDSRVISQGLIADALQQG